MVASQSAGAPVPERSLSHTAWAGRIERAFPGWDLSLSYYNGFNPIPRVEIRGTIPGVDLEAVPVYDRIHVAGFDVSTTAIAEGLELHAETAYRLSEGAEAQDLIELVVGLNYTFFDIILDHDLQVILEYGDQIVMEEGTQDQDIPSLDSPFERTIAARLEYEFSAYLRAELAGVFILKDEVNGLVGTEVSWEPWDGMAVGARVDLLFGGEETFFGQFDHNDRLVLWARYSF